MNTIIFFLPLHFLLLLTGKAQPGLFDSDTVLDIKLHGNIKELISDRGVKSQYHPVTLSYATDTGDVQAPVRVKTRGHFRKAKSNCTYPPLLINTSDKNQQPSSLFYNQDKLKLVMPCRGDEFVVREWLVYKLYNVVTPKSFKARLVKVTLEEMDGKKKPGFYGILIEDDQKMAKRNGLLSIEKSGLRPEYTEKKEFLTMAVFEYMIGNTDWSVQYMQNIRLIASDSFGIPATVPYDFDHSGIVNAPYARPAEELQMSSVKERRYRGYCMNDMKTFDSVIALFNRVKKDLFEVFMNCSMLDAKYIRSMTNYLDDFYSTINNPKKLEKEFRYPCDPNGTGNVVIKGLKED
ncbi:MAG TPA: hypothetical protein VI461_10470 [Chitinophagaceae bacterium]|nr:hypothetical protein [Chitinophagaceae bacterium]